MKADAALIHEPGGPFSIEEVETRELVEDEILVRVRGVGICRTDLSAAAGHLPLPTPFVLGHEGAGIVEGVGPGATELCVGDHVVLSFDSCRTCTSCRSGHPGYCELALGLNYFGARLDGSTTLGQGDADVHGNWFGQSSFASFAVASTRNAVKVDADLPIEILGPLGCGFLTGAGTVLRTLRPSGGQSLAVFGSGAVGLSAVMAAAVAACDPIVAVDTVPERLATAAKLGATHTVNVTEADDGAREIAEIVGPGVDFAIETVGSAAVVRQALESLRTPGVCVTLGAQGLRNDITIDQGHLLMGRTLKGVIEGDADPHSFIPEMIELWRAGRFPFDTLIERFPFAELDAAITAMNAGTVIKPVLTFEP